MNFHTHGTHLGYFLAELFLGTRSLPFRVSPGSLPQFLGLWSHCNCPMPLSRGSPGGRRPRGVSLCCPCRGATLERERVPAGEGVSVGERESASIRKCLQQPRLGAQLGAPVWVAGTPGPSPHLLPPRLQISRRLETESEPRPEPAEVRGGTWVSQQPPSCSAKLLPQHLDSICKLCHEQIPDS